MRKILSCVGVNLMVLFGSGCLKPAMAPKNSLRMAAFPSFSGEDIHLNQNLFFLWPENLSADQVAQVKKASSEWDELLSTNSKLNQEKKEIQARIDEIEGKNRSAQGLSADEISMAIKKKKIAIAHARLALRKASSEGEEAEIQRRIEELEQEKTRLEEERENFNLPKSTQAKTDKLIAEKEEKIKEMDQVLSEINTRFQSIRKVVEFYNLGIQVNFRFYQGELLGASIIGWMLDPSSTVKSSFSTEADSGRTPTIQNLKYDPHGGIFEFDVLVFENPEQTRLQEKFSFSIQRSYESQQNERVSFHGGMIRTRWRPDGVIEIRRGYVRMIQEES